MQNPKISLCIATYRRFDFLSKYLPDYLKNPYIDEIIITDEDGHDYELLETYFDNPKIKLYQNDSKLGPFLNKERAVSLSSNDWVCLMDSDNFAPIDYFESWYSFINKNGINPKNIYCPSKTLPEGNFDFSFMLGKNVNLKTVKELWNLHNFGAYINTGNYIINREEYLNIPKGKYLNDFGIDVQYRNTFMLLNGCEMIAVPKMEYYHIRHEGYYLQSCDLPGSKENVAEITAMLLGPVIKYDKIGNLNNYYDYIKNNNINLLIRNWPCGFGSALTCFITNLYHFKNINKQLKIYPLWDKNSSEFKYSDGNNCFTNFFTDKEDYNKYKETLILECDNPVIFTLFDPNESDEHMKTIKSTFLNRFELSNYVIEESKKILNGKNIIFSIHIRSNSQKVCHYNSNLQNVQNICRNLSLKYDKYSTPYIATDVEEYLQIFLIYFPNAIYNKSCFRVTNDKIDTITQLNDNGSKYGYEILMDVYCLSKGREIYMSKSNIKTMVRLLLDDDSKILNIYSLNE